MQDGVQVLQVRVLGVLEYMQEQKMVVAQH